MEKKYIYKGEEYSKKDLEKLALVGTLKASKHIFSLLGEAAIVFCDRRNFRLIIGNQTKEEVLTETGENDYVTKNIRPISFDNSLAITGDDKEIMHSSINEILVNIQILEEIIGGINHTLYNESNAVMIDINYLKGFIPAKKRS